MITYSIIQKCQLEGMHRLDAEYYQLEYLEIVKNLKRLKATFVNEVAINPKRKFKPKENEPFRYIEISEVDLTTGEYNESEILGENAPDRAQWIVRQNDVIVSTVRPIRNAVSLIKEDAKNLICSSGFAVLESKKIEPEYLFVYLKSRPIVKLLNRQTTATMYPAVTVDDILNIKIYLGRENFRQEIKNKVIEAQKELRQSKFLYAQAEQLLLEKLGIEKLDLDDELFYTVSAKETKETKRFDAEYWQLKYKKLLSYLNKKFEIKKLRDLVNIKKGIEPGSEKYQEEGKPFIRVSNLSQFGINDNDQKYLTDDFYQELKRNYQPKMGEILLSKDATPGIAYVVKESIEGIIAGGILRLRVEADLELEYLALIINLPVGQYQMERDTGGSVIVHWRPEQIRNICIPIIEKSTQQEITSLVKRSHSARKKAKELLEEAKQTVEKIILGK